MKYAIRGKGKVSLNRNDFIFQGGEGKVYGKGDVAYKIYDDPKKTIPEAKIRELAGISHPNVIKPLDMLLDAKNVPVGFAMQWVKNGVPLVKLFTNDFRVRNGITDDTVAELVEAAREMLVSVHSAGCLVVDGNEFNFLVDGAEFKTPFLIDVDSCQTPSFPATAIMASIRDPHSSTFSELTDWYSFAILSCRLFVGIHPFKGRHPDYSRKKYGGGLLQKRMEDHISIFNPKVTVPPSARDFGCIPKNYMNWFAEVFEKGKRLPPPSAAGILVAVAPQFRSVHGTDNFEIKKTREFDSEIVGYRVVYGFEIVKTVGKIHIGRSEYPAGKHADAVFTPKKAEPVLVDIENGVMRFSPADSKTRIHAAPIECSEKMIVENRVFARNQGSLIELSVVDGPSGDIFVAVESTWNIMPNSSTIFDGVIFQSVLGKPHLFIPMPKSGARGACANVYVPELEGRRVVDAKYENGVCMIVANKDGIYSRLTLKFDENHRSYDCQAANDVDNHTVNFTVLDNGVCVAANKDRQVEIFRNARGDNRIDQVDEPNMDTSMRLCRDGVAVKFFKDRTLYGIRRK